MCPFWDHWDMSPSSLATAELILAQTDVCDPMREHQKLQMFLKVLSSLSLRWCYADFHSLSCSKILPVDTVLFCLSNYAIEILGCNSLGREKLSAISVWRKSRTRGMLWREKDKWDSSIADSTKKWQMLV